MCIPLCTPFPVQSMLSRITSSSLNWSHATWVPRGYLCRLRSLSAPNRGGNSHGASSRISHTQCKAGKGSLFLILPSSLKKGLVICSSSPDPLCWLLVASDRQLRPLRMPNHASCSLPIPKEEEHNRKHSSRSASHNRSHNSVLSLFFWIIREARSSTS
jgi:hypothetical protein